VNKITLPRGSNPYATDKGHFEGRKNPGAMFPLYLMVVAVTFLPLPGNVFALTLSGERIAPITIVTQPASRIECEDHVVNFKVVISGGVEPVNYTWQRKRPSEADFTDIPAGSPGISYPAPGTIRVDNVGGNENPGGSRYRVIVSDINGSVTSSDALLTVNEITDIIPSVAFPAKTNVILCQGAGFSYTLTTSGTPPVSYQWKKYLSPGIWMNLTDNGIISGSQTAVLSFTGATPAESGFYKVNITFHSSFTDCQIDSETRTRKLTIQGNLVPPEITNAETLCEGFPPPLLTAAPAGGGSGTFQYQWQNSPDNSSWSDISGATNLSYQTPVPVSAMWYRVNAIDKGVVSCGSVTGLPALLPVVDCYSLHYRTTKDGSWQDRTTWETSPDGMIWGGTAYTFPTASMRTIHIRNDHCVTVSQDVTVDEVTVEPGGAVTVPADKTLTNAGQATDFSINSSATSFGSLIVTGNFSGTLQYRLYADPSRWTIVSPPVKVTSGFAFNNSAIHFNTPTLDYDFAWYCEADNEGWQYFSALPEVLTSGKGYVARTAVTNAPDEGMISFSGTLDGLVNDTVSPEVYNTGTRNGWNGVGNPFTSAIGATTMAATTENFLTRNAAIFEDTYAAIYVWNQTGIYDGSQQYYKAVGNSGYNFRDFSYYAGDDPDYLQVGQGFLINAKVNSNVVFSKAMQVHAPGVRLKSTGKSWPGLVLTATSGSRIRSTVVAFHEKMTGGLDKTYDAGLLASDRFQLYSRLVSEDRGADLEIQCLPDNEYGDLIIPVGLDLPEGGTVTFKVTGVFLPDGWVPVMEDRSLKVSALLKTETDSFRVVVPPGSSGTGRFCLTFRQVTTGSAFPEISSLNARIAVNKMIITGDIQPGSRAALYDLQGRLLGQFLLNGNNYNEFFTGRLPAGIYLLRIEYRGTVKVVKVAITGK
jgi:hypothetical protein